MPAFAALIAFVLYAVSVADPSAKLEISRHPSEIGCDVNRNKYMAKKPSSATVIQGKKLAADEHTYVCMAEDD